MTNPPVTVLIPTFNREKSIKQAIESALAQTYPNTRVLVYDDCSSDGTLRILGDLYSAPRLDFMGGANHRGVSKARNELLSESKTEFNAWLDSDDMMNPWKIELQMQAIQKWDAPFVRTGSRALTPDRKRTWRHLPEVYYAVRQSVVTSLFRKSCAPAFDRRLPILGEDVLWETEMVVNHGTGILLPLVLYFKGRGRDRLSAQAKSKAGVACLKQFETLRAPLLKKLADHGINGRCRIECACVGDLRLPFQLPQSPKSMSAEMRKANRLTSRRIRPWT